MSAVMEAAKLLMRDNPWTEARSSSPGAVINEFLKVTRYFLGVKVELPQLKAGSYLSVASGLYRSLITKNPSFSYLAAEWSENVFFNTLTASRLEEFKSSLIDSIPLDLSVPQHRFLGVLLSLNGRKCLMVMNRGYLSARKGAYILYEIRQPERLSLEVVQGMLGVESDKELYSGDFTKGKRTRGLFLREIARFRADKRGQKTGCCVNAVCLHLLAIIFAMDRYRSSAAQSISDFQHFFEEGLQAVKVFRADSVSPVLKSLIDLIDHLVFFEATFEVLEPSFLILNGICKQMTVVGKSSRMYRRHNVERILSLLNRMKGSPLEEGLKLWFKSRSMNYLYQLHSLKPYQQAEIHQVFGRTAYIGERALPAPLSLPALLPNPLLKDHSPRPLVSADLGSAGGVRRDPALDFSSSGVSAFVKSLIAGTDSLLEGVLAHLRTEKSVKQIQFMRLLFEELVELNAKKVAKVNLTILFDFIEDGLEASIVLNLLERLIKQSANERNVIIFKAAVARFKVCASVFISWSFEAIWIVKLAYETRCPQMLRAVEPHLHYLAAKKVVVKTKAGETVWHLALELGALTQYLAMPKHVKDIHLNKWRESQFLLACLKEDLRMIETVAPHLGSASMTPDLFGLNAIDYLLEAFEAKRMNLFEMQGVVAILETYFDASDVHCPAGNALRALMKNDQILGVNISIGLRIASTFKSTEILQRIVVNHPFYVGFNRDFPWLKFVALHTTVHETKLLKLLLAIKSTPDDLPDLEEAERICITQHKFEQAGLIKLARPADPASGEMASKKRVRLRDTPTGQLAVSFYDAEPVSTAHGSFHPGF